MILLFRISVQLNVEPLIDPSHKAAINGSKRG